MKPAALLGLLVRVGLLPAVLSAGAARAATAADYSDAPLRQPPLMSTAEVAVDLTRFNNWLNEKHASVPDERKPVIREHAYLLIDSVLKARQAEGRTEFNDFDKMALTMMLNWATRFRVYGAGLAARAVTVADGRSVVQTIEPLPPPDPFELRLEFPSYVVSSRESPWRLQFPWYFMIWELRRFTAKNGLVTELVTVSTSFAKHKEGDGKSQATLMFMYSPGSECRGFDEHWLGLLGLDETGRSKEALLPGAASYSGNDAVRHMRKELTLSARSDGCAAFALLGIEGTFEANRVSYLDFIRTFDDGASPAPLAPAPPAVRNPVLVERVPPNYPKKARKKGIEGRVEIRAVIQSDGTVNDAVVQSCTNPGHGLEEAALEAFKQWRYDPATQDDRPVGVFITVVVDFKLAP